MPEIRRVVMSSYLCITAKRSSVVLGRVGVGVGVTMFLSDGAGDDSAVLDSKTSPEGEKKQATCLRLHTQRTKK